MKENKSDSKLNTQNENKKTSLWEIFKFIIGILFSFLIIYKLAVSDLTFDFSKFDFNALLAKLKTAGIML